MMIIYALIDPRNGDVRYVGKSHRAAHHRRLRRHLAPTGLINPVHLSVGPCDWTK
jgi:hypothetical protein